MIQSLNFPLEKEYAASCGGWEEIRKRLAALRLDGVEGIWAGGEEIPEDFPVDLLTGYHLTFFPDWVDLYLENKKELERKFGSEEVIRRVYGGTDPECLPPRGDTLSAGGGYIYAETGLQNVRRYEKKGIHRLRSTGKSRLTAFGRAICGTGYPLQGKDL